MGYPHRNFKNMALASAIITSARYDLRDELETQYSDELLLDYLNRGIGPLCAALAQFRSDWVNNTTTLTLSASASSVALPSYFLSDISVRIGTTYLDKMSVSDIRVYLAANSTSGQPAYYAINGLNMLFSSTADQEYSVVLEYNKGEATLELTDSTPFNGAFDQALRSFIVVMAENRNELDTMTDAAFMDYFTDAVWSNIVARAHHTDIYKTDF